MKTVLPHFYQCVDFNGLDCAYTNIKEAFKAARSPQRGPSDHTAVMLTPVYRALLARTKASLKQVRVWKEGAMTALQGCFDCTAWSVFRETATKDEVVSGYIQKCMEDVCVIKTITNQKPWMTTEARTLVYLVTLLSRGLQEPV